MKKVIKVLLAAQERIGSFTECLRKSAIKRLERKIEVAAERTDMADEAFITRMDMAEKMYKAMQERATNKVQEDYKRANEAKKKAVDAIEELNNL